jgi:MFS family permease
MPAPSVAAARWLRASRYKWSVVLMLWFVCFLNYGDRQAINSIFPKLKGEFGFDEVQLGLIGSAFMWVYAAAAPLAGYVGDRVRRKDLILGGCLFWSLVTITTGWCQRLWQFVGVRAMEGFGETFYFPASMSLLSDYHGPATRSRAMSFHQSSVYAGTIAGSWVAAELALVADRVLPVRRRGGGAGDRAACAAARAAAGGGGGADGDDDSRAGDGDRGGGADHLCESDGAAVDACVPGGELRGDGFSDVDAHVPGGEV